MLYNRVLITGAHGLVGQALVHHMSGMPEYDVLATARDDESRLSGGSFGYAPLDITRTDAVKRLFEDFAPTVVINCAAMTQVDDCEKHRDKCWKVNAEAVEDMARLCRSFGIRLIQLSTDFVFSGDDGPYSEKQRPNPVNFYGRSKLAAENATREAGVDKWAVARTVLVYGTGNKLSRSNIALWLVEALSNNEEVTIVTDQYRTPTYVQDLAHGLERLVHSEKCGIFHLSGREMVSIYDFAHEVAHVFDLDSSLIQPTTSQELNQRAKRPPRTGFVILKSETEIGYRPRSLRDGLRSLRKQLNSTPHTNL